MTSGAMRFAATHPRGPPKGSGPHLLVQAAPTGPIRAWTAIAGLNAPIGSSLPTSERGGSRRKRRKMVLPAIPAMKISGIVNRQSLLTSERWLTDEAGCGPIETVNQVDLPRPPGRFSTPQV